MNPYVLLAACAAALALAGGGYLKGRHDEHASHLEQLLHDTNEARRIEQRAAANRQEADDAKDAELRRVRDRLGAALDELRHRPERLPEPARATCAGATGAELSGPDAAFLEREAARADDLRAELGACQTRERAALTP